MAFAAQTIGNERRKPGVVLDQKDPHGSHRPRSWQVCRASLPISNRRPNVVQPSASKIPRHATHATSSRRTPSLAPDQAGAVRDVVGRDAVVAADPPCVSRVTFVYAGLQKFLDPGFLHAGSPTYIGTQLQGFARATPAAPLMQVLSH